MHIPLWSIYRDGFRRLPRWGKILILIIVVKLFVMFGIFKACLMPDYLDNRFDTDEQKSRHILKELTIKPEL